MLLLIHNQPGVNMQANQQEMLAALLSAQKLFDEALPKFNWGASCLDARAISLLNTVPNQVRKAIENNKNLIQHQ